MTPEQFLDLQAELWWAFGPLARWWMILFAVTAFGMSVVIFIMRFVSNWLESR